MSHGVSFLKKWFSVKMGVPFRTISKIYFSCSKNSTQPVSSKVIVLVGMITLIKIQTVKYTLTLRTRM